MNATFPAKARRRRARARASLAGLLLLALTSPAQAGERGEPAPMDRAAPTIAGQVLRSRFDSGRTYRVEYGQSTAHFLLLEPAQADPPSKTLPYRAVTLREGLFLVVWEDPGFYTTFVVDLERGQVHASSLRGGQQMFFATAEILD